MRLITKLILAVSLACWASPAIATTTTAKATVDLNQSQCVKEVVNVGSTTYHNICSGAVVTVSWGIGDWLSNVALSLLIGVVLFIFGGGLVAFIWALFAGRL